MDEGCNGGYMTDAYGQIISMSGLMTEDDYKYEGRQHTQCSLDKSKIKVNIDGYLNITSDENGKNNHGQFFFHVFFFLSLSKKWLNG